MFTVMGCCKERWCSGNGSIFVEVVKITETFERKSTVNCNKIKWGVGDRQDKS